MRYTYKNTEIGGYHSVTGVVVEKEMHFWQHSTQNEVINREYTQAQNAIIST